MEPIHVKVTEEHIRNGNRKTCSSCPIHHAILHSLRLLFPDGTFEVGHCGVYKKTEQEYVRTHDIPSIVCILSVRFDEGEEVQPIAFDLIPVTG